MPRANALTNPNVFVVGYENMSASEYQIVDYCREEAGEEPLSLFKVAFVKIIW